MMNSCRSTIIPFTEYMHVMPMQIHLSGKLGQFSSTSCKCFNRSIPLVRTPVVSVKENVYYKPNFTEDRSSQDAKNLVT